jgi:hypothetical protein
MIPTRPKMRTETLIFVIAFTSGIMIGTLVALAFVPRGKVLPSVVPVIHWSDWDGALQYRTNLDTGEIQVREIH